MNYKYMHTFAFTFSLLFCLATATPVLGPDATGAVLKGFENQQPWSYHEDDAKFELNNIDMAAIFSPDSDVMKEAKQDWPFTQIAAEGNWKMLDKRLYHEQPISEEEKQSLQQVLKDLQQNSEHGLLKPYQLAAMTYLIDNVIVESDASASINQKEFAEIHYEAMRLDGDDDVNSDIEERLGKDFNLSNKECVRLLTLVRAKAHLFTTCTDSERLQHANSLLEMINKCKPLDPHPASKL